MSLKFYYPAAILLLLAIGLQGCAILLNSNMQKVKIENPTPGAVAVMQSDTLSSNTLRLSKLKGFYGISVRKDGYKERNICLGLNEREPKFRIWPVDVAATAGLTYTFLTPQKKDVSAMNNGLIWSALTGLAMMRLDHVFYTTFRYSPVTRLPELVPFRKRSANEKYLLVTSTLVDVKPDSIKLFTFTGMKNFSNCVEQHKSNLPGGISLSRSQYKVENSYFTTAINASLKKFNYLDTTESVLSGPANSLYLSARINAVKFFVITSDGKKVIGKNTVTNQALCMEMAIDWKVQDGYKQNVDSFHTSTLSDVFVLQKDKNVENSTVTTYKAIKDNFENAIIEVSKNLEQKGLLTKGSTVTDKPAIVIAKPQPKQNQGIADFYKSCVTVKADDKQGSGVFISEDGYLLTAYHIVVGSKKIEVILNDKTRLTAELVRESKESDLALLKVTGYTAAPLLLSEEKEAEIGTDVLIIGTPNATELAQTVSKGIISGIRKSNELTMVQTDASVSPGNSGSPLMNREGVVYGIVSNKVVEYGAEGIAFAVSSADILRILKLQYK
jgi:S1-C subfamily serine protease